MILKNILAKKSTIKNLNNLVTHEPFKEQDIMMIDEGNENNLSQNIMHYIFF
jgi:hypothetical protein